MSKSQVILNMANDKGPKYKVGISSGWWSIGKDPALLGIAMKIGGFGATSGVQFNQIDLDTTAEFYEPRLIQNVKKIKSDLKLEVGIHAEVGKIAALESAERKVWEQAHVRLVELAKGAADIGAVYINFHLSTEIQVEYEEARLKPFGHMYQVVGPDGEPLWRLGEKDSKTKEFIISLIDEEFLRSCLDEPQRKEYIGAVFGLANEKAEEEYNNYVKTMTPEQLAKTDLKQLRIAINKEWQENANRGYGKWLPEKIFEGWKKSMMGKYFVQFGEIGAYMITGFFMKSTGDFLWSNIVKSDIGIDEAYATKSREFNAAIASKYIEGHLKVKDNEFNKKHLNGMSVLEWCEKHKIVIAFESPEVEMAHELGGQAEGIYRLFHPCDAYFFVKKMNSPSVRLCIDFEHTMAQKIDIDKVLDEVPDDFGKYVFLFHLGEPKPYQGKAHIPIPMGSQAQEIIYNWLYKMKKKGFENGILIFERGGGRSGGGKTPFEVFEHSVWVLRKFSEFLEKNIKPDDLPPSFFGIAEDEKDIFARQSVIIREHAWDPLEGVLMIPEEKHGFLGKSAVDKGKAKEWDKGRFR